MRDNEPMLGRVGRFLTDELWRDDLGRSRGVRGAGISALRIVVHAFGSFARNMGSIRAAGLSLITLLALVPLLALATALARAFAYGDRMKEEISRWSRESLSPPLQEALAKAQDIAESTNFRAIGVVGTLILAYACFELFTRVEQAFNNVWKSETRRKWYRRVSDFTALVVIVPVLVLGALSLSSILQGTSLHGLREKYVWVRAVYEAGLGFVPHVIMWIGLTALYKIMPSAPVAWRGAMVGGIAAGSAWVLLHSLYIHFQIGVVQFNAIYATLAAVPLLIAYLQVTWTILLMGAEIAYGVQNVHALKKTKAVPPANHAVRRRLGLLLVSETCRGFARGETGSDLHEIAVRCDVPREWVDGVYRSLADAGIVAKVDGTERVVPARPPAKISTTDVFSALEKGEADAFLSQIRLDPEMERRLALRAEAERAAVPFGFDTDA